jgi:hypothetical protein
MDFNMFPHGKKRDNDFPPKFHQESLLVPAMMDCNGMQLSRHHPSESDRGDIDILGLEPLRQFNIDVDPLPV